MYRWENFRNFQNCRNSKQQLPGFFLFPLRKSVKFHKTHQFLENRLPLWIQSNFQRKKTLSNHTTHKTNKKPMFYQFLRHFLPKTKLRKQLRRGRRPIAGTTLRATGIAGEGEAASTTVGFQIEEDACHTVDGWNPANQLRLVVEIPLLRRFYTCWVVQDFFHQA